MTSPPLFYQTFDIQASPADATETVIATLTGVCSQQASNIFKLAGSTNVTPEASGADVILRIRRNTLTGTLVAGPVGVPGEIDPNTGGVLAEITGQDSPGDSAGAVYVLTATITSAAGASVVNQVSLTARVD